MTKTETFHKIDINGNGLVDKSQLSDGLKEMGIAIGLIAKVLTVFDRDASGEITLDQWLNILGEDVEMEEIDVPPPPPKKKDKKVVAKPKKEETQSRVEEEKIKKEEVNKTAPSKVKKQPLKNQDKNKTLKPSEKKSSKKEIMKPKPVATTFAQDEYDTKT